MNPLDWILTWSYTPVIFWLIALAVFLLIEAATAGLVSLWFAGGALVAVIVSLLHGPAWLQILLFLLVSAVLLALLRPLTRRYIAPRYTPTNADRILGAEALVTEAIDNVAGTGVVRLGGVDWTARSANRENIDAGVLVKILHIEGAKVTVEPVQVPAQK